MDLAVGSLLLLLYLAGLAFVVSGTVDVFQFSQDTWSATGYRRVHWAWQVAGVLALPAGLVYSGIYFARVRPRLSAAQATFAQLDPEYASWMDRRRWYDRLVWARRSPDRWARAARQWWMWALYAVGAALLAILNAQLTVPWSYLPAIGWGLTALVSAGRAGFWYAEHMRLTGRRPSAGGPLIRGADGGPRI